jgi:hypothetical protein
MTKRVSNSTPSPKEATGRCMIEKYESEQARPERTKGTALADLWSRRPGAGVALDGDAQTGAMRSHAANTNGSHL